MRKQPSIAIFLAALAATGLPAGADAPALELVVGGQAKSVLVVPLRATKNEMAAAREIRDYVKRVSGADLALLEEPRAGKPMPTPAIISIGATQLAKAAGLRIVSSDPEAFRIVRRGRTVFLLGRGKPGYEKFFRNSLGSGIEFAAFEFIERVCGVRWLRPGPKGTYVPRRSALSVGHIDLEQAPSFQYRWYNYWYEGKAAKVLGTPYWKARVPREMAQLHDWMKHNKMNGCRVIPGGHAFVKIVPKSEYAEHPKYFALVKGSRQPRGAHHSGWQLCTSNPEVIDRAVQYVGKRFRAGQLVVSIMPNDGMGFCECDRCRALDNPNWKDGRGRVILSDRIATFVNAVARRVRQDYPDRFVGSESYSRYKEPPRRVMFEPNVMLWLTNRQYFNWMPGRSEKFYAFYKTWNVVQPHLFVLSSEYLTHESRWGLPWPILPLDADVIQWAGRHEEYKTRSGPSAIQNDWGTNGPLYWAVARLLWNSGQEVNALMKDYCSAMYGKAAEPMQAYWDRLTRGEREWQQGLQERPRLVNVAFHAAEIYSPAVRSDCRKRLQQAARLAGTPWAKANVEFSAKGFAYTQMTAEAMGAYRHFLKAKDAADIGRTTRTLRALWKRRRAFIEQQRDDHVVGYGQFNLMVLNGSKFGSQQSKEQRFAFFESIQLEKLLNRGFEDDLWGNWYRFTWGQEARWTTTRPHAGKRCLSIVDSGSVGQLLAVVPGRTYRLRGWIRTADCKSAGVRVYSFDRPAFMWLYRLAKQRWKMRTQADKAYIAGTTDWQSLTCEVTPQTAELLIECFNNDRGEAFFDDFSMLPSRRKDKN